MLFRFSRSRLPHVLATASITLLLAACSRGTPPAAPMLVDHHGTLFVPAGSPLRAQLTVQPVLLHDVAQTITEPAVVEQNPAYTANILPPATGRIVKLAVGLGERVKRGQVLAVIASGDAAQAYADFAKARDALALARATLQRELAVQTAGGAAGKDVQAARSGAAQAQAEYDRARAALAALDHAGQGGRITLVAPEAGTVTMLAASPGAFVNDPTAPLMTVTDTAHVWITASVPEDEIGPLRAGQPATATLPAWPGRVFHGSVQSVGAVLDPATQRLPVRIAVANGDGALKPNMFAMATFDVPRPPALLVPQSALLMHNDNVSVFVETAPWTFVRRTVTLGEDTGNDSLVTGGLKAGERVVTAGGVLLND